MPNDDRVASSVPSRQGSEKRGTITPGLYAATSPAGLRVSHTRLALCSWRSLKYWSVVLAIGVVTALLFWWGLWWAALLPLGAFLFIGAAGVAAFRNCSRQYRTGNLVAAVVVSRSPFRYVALTDLRKDLALAPCHAVLMKEDDCPALWAKPRGTRLACAAVYHGGTDEDLFWKKFFPMPLFMATWSRRKVTERQATIDPQDYALLDRAIEDGLAPVRPGDIRVLDNEYVEAVLRDTKA